MFLLWLIPALCLAILGISHYCYQITFYVKEKHIIGPEEYPVPSGSIYEPYREQMIQWMKQIRKIPHQELYTTSHDGLQLYAKYFAYTPGAPVEIMFHGYRGCAERDLCGGVQRAFALGHSALIVDQRGAGHSGGRTISFGVNESQDCLRWIEKAIQQFGPDTKIILTGISMGAATVMITAGNDLPDNVIGVLADCGYTTGKEIIQVVTRKLHIPPRIAYPFVWLGARIFGRFDLRKADATAAMQRCKVPVIFLHGDTDDFVPWYMSKKNYDACRSRKELVTIPNAGHALAYLLDPETYIARVRAFFHGEQAEKI